MHTREPRRSSRSGIAFLSGHHPARGDCKVTLSSVDKPISLLHKLRITIFHPQNPAQCIRGTCDRRATMIRLQASSRCFADGVLPVCFYVILPPLTRY